MINVACSYPNCQNPVIGQCAGFEKSCGRYYCAVHSEDRLCFECAIEKNEALVQAEYARIAQDVTKRAARSLWKEGLLAIGVIFFVIFLGINGGDSVTNVLPFWLPLLMIVGVNFWFMLAVTKRQSQWAQDVGKDLPGFENFYAIWRKNKNKNDLMKSLQIAGGIAVVALGIGAAVQRQGAIDDLHKIRRALEKY